MSNNLLPCRIPRDEHPICWERNCYLSGEGCPVHQGPKKRIITKLPSYVAESELIGGERIFVGANQLFQLLCA